MHNQWSVEHLSEGSCSNDAVMELQKWNAGQRESMLQHLSSVQSTADTESLTNTHFKHGTLVHNSAYYNSLASTGLSFHPRPLLTRPSILSALSSSSASYAYSTALIAASPSYSTSSTSPPFRTSLT